MGAIKLAAPEMGMDVEALTNLMFRYYRELEYLLNGNIDSQNVKSLTTDKIIAGEALIGTALIDTLVVGTNVGIGSAPKVFSAQPTTPYRVNDIWIDGTDLKRCTVARSSGAYVATDWGLGTNYTNPTGVTSIVGGVITTDYVNALNVTAGSVAAENITGTTITGKTISGGTITGTTISGTTTIDVGTDLNVGNNIYIGNTATGDPKGITFFSGSTGSDIAHIIAHRLNYPTNNYTDLYIEAYDIILWSINRPNWKGVDFVVAYDLDRYIKPFYAENICYLDYSVGLITVRNASGTSVGTIPITP